VSKVAASHFLGSGYCSVSIVAHHRAQNGAYRGIPEIGCGVGEREVDSPSIFSPTLTGL
jgi:hypothetical protein